MTLRPAGGGSLKGLCPFHEERSPSFHVTPAKGFFHCFGCQAGGDVIDFVRKYDQLDFAEAVEKLAGRVGIVLRYEEGGAAPDRQRGQRVRLVDAHREAARFYEEMLGSPGAGVGREFLSARDFDADAAAHFGVGFAPEGWDALTKHLRSKGFTDPEMITAGLAVAGQRGAYDRFRGRLVWPIRDLSGDVIGFGARKLLESDQGPKYLNTPETPLYKKSQVLYGVDLARREISKQQRAVIVEGYTDVMAAHLSGVPTAVATCGTAFGHEHIKILRRLLMDQDEFRGEVIFTFDGDAAGRKAALRAFEDDQRFVAQTYVAIEPHGLDPCELRQQHGPEAVRELVARRVPLFQFAIRSAIADHDLDTAEGRVAALRASAPLLARIKDQALRPEYARLVAGWIGIEQSVVTDEVRRLSRADAKAPAQHRSGRAANQQQEPVSSVATPTWERPDPRSTAASVEREAIKCALQIPLHVDAWYATVEPNAYTVPLHVAVHGAIAGAGLPGSVSNGHDWIEAVLLHCPDDQVRAYVRELVVDPLHTNDASDEDRRVYGLAVLARLLEMDATRRTVELKHRLQRTSPTDEPEAYNRMFADLLGLEQVRRQLREQALGGLGTDEPGR
ncbi:MAG: DNA primase [Actinomycetes bacterium]